MASFLRNPRRKSWPGAIRRCAESALGIRIVRNPPHGFDEFHDIKRLKIPIRTIVDVGANVGQYAIRCRQAYPQARILSFEPVAESFAVLRKNAEQWKFECRELALGHRSGHTLIYRHPDSRLSSLLPLQTDTEPQKVEVTTMDQFCEHEHILHVDLWKVDAEGFDPQVLAGGEHMLKSGQISLVLTEVGFRNDDQRHAPYEQIRDLLAPFGFSLIGFYEQTTEWTGKPWLSFANALFGQDGLKTEI